MLQQFSKQLIKQLRLQANRLLERHCAICEELSDNPLCNDCLSSIQKPEFSCKQCGHQMEVETQQQICKNCLNNPPQYLFTDYIGTYEGNLRDLILRAKLKKDISAISALRYLVNIRINSFCCNHNNETFKQIIPMPTPKSRLITRGYNLPEILAKDIIFHKNNNLSLINTISTPFFKQKQATLSLQQRQKNHHNFKIKQKIIGNIIIFDDIITTGNTVNSLAKVINKNSYKHPAAVTAWALARGKLD